MSQNDNWWGSLTPDEQDALMMQSLGPTGPTLAQYGFENDTGGFGAEPFDFSYTGAPTSGMGVQPQVDYFTTKGKVKPGDLAEEAKRVNLLQDYGSLSVDNILSGYAGAGAYDTGAFTPTYEFGEPLNLKGRRKAESLSKTGGWQGFVTDLILNNNLSPAEAEAELYKTINAPDSPDLTDQQRQLKASLSESMKPLIMPKNVSGQIPGAGGSVVTQSPTKDPYNADVIRQFTTNVWSDLMEDPEFSYQDPKTGLYYGKTPEEAIKKTPQMLAYDKFGIPYPTATYEDQKYLDEFARSESGGLAPDEIEAAGEGWQARQSKLEKAAAGETAKAKKAGTAAASLEDIWGKYQAQPQGYAPTPSGPPTNPYNLSAPSIEAAKAAAKIDAGGTQDKDLYDRMFQEAMTRAARHQGANVPGVAPAVRTTGAGDIEPFTFGSSPGLPEQQTAIIDAFRGKAPFATAMHAGQGPRRATEQDVAAQRQRAQQQTRNASQQQNAVFQETYRDPRLAQIAALGRAYALQRAGQTPFRDAMAARNANARTMLSG